MFQMILTAILFYNTQTVLFKMRSFFLIQVNSPFTQNRFNRNKWIYDYTIDILKYVSKTWRETAHLKILFAIQLIRASNFSLRHRVVFCLIIMYKWKLHVTFTLQITFEEINILTKFHHRVIFE